MGTWEDSESRLPDFPLEALDPNAGRPQLPTNRKAHHDVTPRTHFSFKKTKPLKYKTGELRHPRGERKKKERKKTENEREGKLKSAPFDLSPLRWTKGTNFIWVGRRMQAFARMTLPIRRVWTGVAARIGVRESGHMKLGKDVRSCEYEDVRVMWEMLSRNEAETIGSPTKTRCKKRTLSSCLEWARRSPFLCRSF